MEHRADSKRVTLRTSRTPVTGCGTQSESIALPPAMEATTRAAGVTRSRGLGTSLTTFTLATCVALVGFKAFLAWRININWDEFWYLSFVHSLLRGELTVVLQGAYTHLFTWLPWVADNEADQIVAARLVMVALLGLTAWLVWLLGRRWLDGPSSALPPFVYLTFVPVTVHGGSFRSDSMLAPLLMGALVLAGRPQRTQATDLFAGALVGIAAAVTVKILLFVPLLVVYYLLAASRDHGEERSGTAMLRSLCWIGTTAGIVACMAVGAHAVMISGAAPAAAGAIPVESLSEFATRTANGMIVNSPLFARANLVSHYAFWQPLPWILMGLGLVSALYRRQYDLAALALALLPIVVYRNSFSYFFVVMLAPASILAGYTVWGASKYLKQAASPMIQGAFLLIVWIGLFYQHFAYVGRFAQNNQSVQRQLISAVHAIFPEPIPYIDRCGMIGSFRKANFFMSTWGLQDYRAKGKPFMQGILRDERPAFVIMNTPALAPSRPRANGLLEEDRLLLQKFYPRYWGPIRVAGGSMTLAPGHQAILEVPFPARYRVVTNQPVLIEGNLTEPGAVLPVTKSVRIELPADSKDERVVATLVLASAQPPPQQSIDPQPIFTGL